MNDLNAIFLYGRDQKMYIYYPNAKSLVENILPLPAGFTISDMGTYLTYLYAFDAKQGRILRFPRAEGGFGTPTEWLKEKISFDEKASMSIGESILIGSKSSIFSFTKGKGGALAVGKTIQLIDIQNISIATDGSLTILDTTAKRIIRFSADGQLTGQYFNQQLGDASSLTTSSDGNIAFISIKEKILSFELQ
jgi:tricorn protease-like protein